MLDALKWNGTSWYSYVCLNKNQALQILYLKHVLGLGNSQIYHYHDSTGAYHDSEYYHNSTECH